MEEKAYYFVQISLLAATVLSETYRVHILLSLFFRTVVIVMFPFTVKVLHHFWRNSAKCWGIKSLESEEFCLFYRIHYRNSWKESRNTKLFSVNYFHFDDNFAHTWVLISPEPDPTEKTIERSPFFDWRGGHCYRRDLVGRTTFWFFFWLAYKFRVWLL